MLSDSVGKNWTFIPGNQNAYKWENLNSSYFKGYLVERDSNSVLRGRNAIREIANACTSTEALSRFLLDYEGHFSFVVHREGAVFIGVDRARSMPLYFSENNKQISDVSEYVYASFKRSDIAYSKDSLVELFFTRSVNGNRTVYEDVEQLDAGQIAVFTNDEMKIATYYQHCCSNITHRSRRETKDALDDAIQRAFLRTLAAIGQRPILLSLSGGYDSRLVACMLKDMGASNVSCYTYGKLDSFEVKKSEEVAKALNFRWRCVEYDEKRIKSLLDEPDIEYVRMSRQDDCIPYLQNYIAVKTLHEDHWIEPDTVVLTGLCGDMPSGQYIPDLEELGEKVPLTVDGLAQYYYRQNYQRYSLEEREKHRVLTRVCNEVSKLPFDIKDYQTFASALDSLLTTSVHSRVFLNMNRAHDFFGYEWIMPLWDSEWLDEWYQTPTDQRAHQRLYEEWLMERVYSPYGLDQRKVYYSLSHNLMIAHVKRWFGGMAAFALRHLGLPIRRKGDFNNFAGLEQSIYTRIHDKSLINYRRCSLTLLLTIFIIQDRYGDSAIETIADSVKRKI